MNHMKLSNLESIRKQRNLSRRELADLSNVSQGTITALEYGTNDAFNVKLSTLIALSQALEVKVIDLIPDELKSLIA